MKNLPVHFVGASEYGTWARAESLEDLAKKMKAPGVARTPASAIVIVWVIVDTKEGAEPPGVTQGGSLEHDASAVVRRLCKSKLSQLLRLKSF